MESIQRRATEVVGVLEGKMYAEAEGRPDGGCSSSQGVKDSAELCSLGTVTEPKGTAQSCQERVRWGFAFIRGRWAWSRLPKTVGTAPTCHSSRSVSSGGALWSQTGDLMNLMSPFQLRIY